MYPKMKYEDVNISCPKINIKLKNFFKSTFNYNVNYSLTTVFTLTFHFSQLGF